MKAETSSVRTVVLALIAVVVAIAIALATVGGYIGVAGWSSASAQEPMPEALRVGIKPLEPFVFVDGATPTGFSIDYWNEVATRLGVTTEWVEYETVSDVIEAARVGEVDASIAGISITAEREALIDFSQPYYNSGQQIVTRLPASSGPFGLARSLFRSTFLIPLAGLAALVLVVSHLVWWFERGHESDDFPYEYRQGIGEAMWWSTVSVLTGGEAVKNINTALSRIIAIFWMVIGFFVLAGVTARLASATTVNALQSDINNIEDLQGKSVTTVAGTATVDFLRVEGRITARLAPDLDTALADLAAEQTDAVVFDAPVVAYVIKTQYGGELMLAGAPLDLDPYGIALPQNSELLEEVNSAVIAIGRDGTLQDLQSVWFDG